MKRVCLTPHLSGVGGMVSFQGRLAAGLSSQGIEISHDLADRSCQAVLVIGGTRNLSGLWRLRRSGVRIVQRLNGMNWLHRKRYTGLRHFLRAEYGNLLLQTIRSRLADYIVYQSEFSRSWWENVHGPTRAANGVVYNGVDLSVFIPEGAHNRPTNSQRVLLVEGNLGGGYELGLETAVQLISELRSKSKFSLELMVVGRVSPELQRRWQQRASFPIQFTGIVSHGQIPYLDRSAHLLYAADLHAACPNSVIEALACGLPVAAFDTGSLRELVQGNAGRLAPYGGDAWKVEAPDTPALARAAAEILENQPPFRETARAWAQEQFNVEKMVAGYRQALLEG